MTKENLEILIGIGDIHGNLIGLKQLLGSLDETYGIFDESGRINKSVGIEFNGDYIDRGRESLGVLEYVKELDENNPTVVVKPGNHELLALADLDVVKRLKALAEESEKPIQEGAILNSYWKQTLHGRNGGDTFLMNFGRNDKEMVTNYISRMNRDGDLGEWLRNLDCYSIREIGDKRVLFTHADIDKQIRDAEMLYGFGKTYKEHMAGSTITKGGSERKYSPKDIMVSGLLWGRRFQQISPQETSELLDKLNVDYVVVGHTDQEGEIQNIHDRIFNVDVGIWRGEDPGAIVFSQEGIEGHYVGKDTVEIKKF